MKLTKKVIKNLGGVPVSIKEGGGCVFRTKNIRIDFCEQDIPDNVHELIDQLMEYCYQIGKEKGKELWQSEFKKLIGF